METIAIVAPFPNPHVLEIFHADRFQSRMKYDLYCFRSLPAHRQGLGWVEEKFNSLSASYLDLRANARKLESYKSIIYYGAIDPSYIPAFLIRHSLRRGQDVYLYSEGFRHRPSYWKKLCFRHFLNYKNLTILAVGDRSSDDYRGAGILKASYRKFGFFEKYRPFARQPREIGTTCRLLSVGQLIDRKNFTSVVESLLRISPHLKRSVHYTICGEGNQRAELEAMISKAPINLQIELTGNQNADQLAAHFGDADIFVMPSRYDGWGVVLNQAIHYELPVVASSGVRAGRGHLVSQGKNGFIYETPDQLDRYLIDLIDDEVLRQSLSIGALQTKQMWDREEVAGQFARYLLKEPIRIESDSAPLSQL